MSDRCLFSFGPVDISSTAQNYAAQCPACGAIRETIRRGGGRVFPPHAPLAAKPQSRACWKRDDVGMWHWKPIVYTATIMYSDRGIVAIAERAEQ